MDTGALVFMAVSWTFVLGLMAWAFTRILRNPQHFDPDGIGPEKPPTRGRAEPPDSA